MKNTFGYNLTLTLFGESHGPAVGGVLDGVTPGIPVDTNAISEALLRRLGDPELSTSRREPDAFVIESGIKDGYTTGAPIALLIANTDVKPEDYSYANTPRPGHADLTALLKYGKCADLSGGGHFSGRLTAPIVALGEIVKSALDALGISVFAKVTQVGGASDEPAIREAVLSAKAEGDSLGGIVETRISGLPAGLGDPFFDSVESRISHAVFSIGGVKGVEFGDGFALASARGSEVNDEIGQNAGKPMAKTSHAGGVFGGITDGSDVIFRVAVKPTPSIAKAQKTLDLTTGKEVELTVSGRHDPAFVLRLPAVLEALTALTVGDMLVGRFGERALNPKVFPLLTE